MWGLKVALVESTAAAAIQSNPTMHNLLLNNFNLLLRSRNAKRGNPFHKSRLSKFPPEFNAKPKLTFTTFILQFNLVNAWLNIKETGVKI